MRPVLQRMWLSSDLESPSKHHSVFFISLFLGFYVLSLSPIPLLPSVITFSSFIYSCFLFPHSFAFVNVPSSLSPPILASRSRKRAGNNVRMRGAKLAYQRNVCMCVWIRENGNITWGIQLRTVPFLLIKNNLPDSFISP